MTTHRPIDIDPKTLGARLRIARQGRGMTQESVAELLGVARTTLVAIEKGERKVKASEIVRLAEILRRQVSELVAEGPATEGFSVQLRNASPPSASGDEDLLAAIDSFQQLCVDYVRLETICGAPLKQRYPTPYEMDGTDPELAAEDAATAERGRLRLGDGPLLNLREVLESEVGVRIFQPELPSAVAGMFACSDELGACIAVNGLHPAERRRHSLAHEYGHFLVLRNQSDVLFGDRYQRRPAEERFVETFARAFLMPEEGLRRKFLDLRRERGGVLTHGDLCRLAHSYAVSAEAMTRRLEELRLIPAGVWDRLRLEGFRVEEALRLLGLEPILAEDGLLPHRFVSLAVEAWQRGDLSEGQLARLLRVDRVEARKMVDRIEGPLGGDHEPEGRISLAAPLLGVA